tara:strand:+ start:1152 stop:1382 length:231 start_codon:yes stop_codon:yes gene_type:complete
MKTFTSIEKFTVGTIGHKEDGRIIFLIEADPKREGLYKMSEIQTEAGKKARKYPAYYGKCNQSIILELSKGMIEVV